MQEVSFHTVSLYVPQINDKEGPGDASEDRYSLSLYTVHAMIVFPCFPIIPTPDTRHPSPASGRRPLSMGITRSWSNSGWTKIQISQSTLTPTSRQDILCPGTSRSGSVPTNRRSDQATAGLLPEMSSTRQRSTRTRWQSRSFPRSGKSTCREPFFFLNEIGFIILVLKDSPFKIKN